MRVAALVGVLDEVELIETAILHLQNIGVDDIVISDGGSSDGTVEVIERFVTDGNVHLRRFDEARLDLISPVYAWAMEHLQPDWLLVTDADEFWLPRTGSIKNTAALAEPNPMRVERFNVPIVAHSSFAPEVILNRDYERLFLITRPEKGARDEILAQGPTTDESVVPWLMAPQTPKVFFRPDPALTIGAGGHNVQFKKARLQHYSPMDLIIAHVPFTNFGRFRNKVKNIRRWGEKLVEHGIRFTGTQGWHWRRWKELSEKELLAEFNNQVFQEDTASLRERGVIQTVADLFESRTRGGDRNAKRSDISWTLITAELGRAAGAAEEEQPAATVSQPLAVNRETAASVRPDDKAAAAALRLRSQAEMLAAIEDGKGQAQKLARSLTNAASLLEKAEGEAAQQREKASTAAKKLAAAREKSAELTQRLADATEVLAAGAAQRAELDQRLDGMTIELDEARSNNSDLAEREGRLGAELDRTRRELGAANAAVARLEDELASIRRLLGRAAKLSIRKAGGMLGRRPGPR